MINPNSPLLTDLYQLTMAQSYVTCNMRAKAVFEFFVRKIPSDRNFLIAAGLQQVLEYLENLRFTPAEITWLHKTGRFDNALLSELKDFRFTGSVYAMPEGAIFFANEPIIRVEAPILEAQLVESRIINLLQFQTMIASKAVRSTLAAEGKPLVDFSLRRAHGAEAALLSARASYIAGFEGTSTVQAAQQFGIPLFGTVAHSFVMASSTELQAFINYASTYPDNAVLLLDTYNVEKAANKVVGLGSFFASAGITLTAVRLDSGDLGHESRKVREILDKGGMRSVKILVSGNLDEYSIQELVKRKAPIDGFGVGTKMGTSSDAPYLECAYKLQEYDGVPRRKVSAGKETLPGVKNVYREFNPSGLTMMKDTVGLESEVLPGKKLLEEVMRDGKITQNFTPLDRIRSRVMGNLTRLPARLLGLRPAAYVATASSALLDLAKQHDERQPIRKGAAHES